jgi:Uma2 family endonuclease
MEGTMSASSNPRRMSAGEFFNFVHRPENAGKWFELVRGEVMELPPSNKMHGFVCANITRLLGNYTFEQGRFYVTGNDFGVLLERGTDVTRGPDLALYDDAAGFPDLQAQYGEVPPLLAVDVLSPNDRLGRVLRRTRNYLAAGVVLVWMVDVETRNVTVHRLAQQPAIVEEQEELSAEEVLPGFRCLVSDLFRFPGEKRAAA